MLRRGPRLDGCGTYRGAMRMHILLVAALALASLPVAASDAPDPSVTYAPSWEAAVQEAKTLNMPIVVHRHGWT